MERAEWLKQMRNKAESLYDHLTTILSMTKIIISYIASNL